MDVLSLPDVCLRTVMRKVSLRDRARLRETCSAFETLVAQSNAGYFCSGGLELQKASSSFWIDDLRCASNSSPEESLEEFRNTKNRLFNGVTVEEFTFILQGDCDLTSIRALIERISMNQIRFAVDSEAQLDNALQLMTSFPDSEFELNINNFEVETEKMLLFPAMAKLSISQSASQISTVLFFKLINSHRNLLLGFNSPALTSSELKKAMQILSNDEHSRTVKLKVRNSSIVRNLRDFGISEASNTGYCINEFETVFSDPGTAHSYASLKLRYRHCWMEIVDFDWGDADLLDFTVSVTLTNFEIPETPTRKKAFFEMQGLHPNAM